MTDPASPWLTTPAAGPLMPPADAAAYLGLSRATFYRRVEDGSLPRPIKMSAKATGLPKPWLDSVIAARAAASLELAR